MNQGARKRYGHHPPPRRLAARRRMRSRSRWSDGVARVGGSFTTSSVFAVVILISLALSRFSDVPRALSGQGALRLVEELTELRLDRLLAEGDGQVGLEQQVPDLGGGRGRGRRGGQRVAGLGDPLGDVVGVRHVPLVRVVQARGDQGAGL